MLLVSVFFEFVKLCSPYYDNLGRVANPRPVATGRVCCVCDWLRDAIGLVFECSQCCCEFVNSIKYTFAHIFSKVTFFCIRIDKVNVFQ